MGLRYAVTDNDQNPRMVAGLDLNEAEDGLIVYEETTDTVHHLNKTAAAILGLCDGTRDPAAIAAAVAELYELETDPTEETLRCLAELSEKSLIRWSAEPTPR